MAFVEGFSLKRPFIPFSRGKNRISQGVENQGSLISVPLALRVGNRLENPNPQIQGKDMKKNLGLRPGRPATE